MIDFNTHPDRYHHWRLTVDGSIARLEMVVEPNTIFGEDYELKLNSYDLGVDLELADVVQRLRFEHPAVQVCIVTSGVDRVFCAGANIPMLGASTHAFKVNFCKYTNETRLSLEDASRELRHHGSSRQLNGQCRRRRLRAGDLLRRDLPRWTTATAARCPLPEVPLLGVLPGTGGPDAPGRQAQGAP